MKKYLITLITTAMTILGLVSCSDPDVDIQRFASGDMMPGRIDLSGAVSLAMGGNNNSRAIDGEYLSAGLYKIDAQGRISAVAVYFTTDKNGNRLEHEEKLRLQPIYLHKLTDNYIIAAFCNYYDKDGDFVTNQWVGLGEDDYGEWIKQEVPYKNLLIRLSDGKIWCIDQIAEKILSNEYGQYHSYDISCGKKIKGLFTEDSHGILYHNAGSPGLDVYRFNLSGLNPSYEQIAFYGAGRGEAFYITDNGVAWGIKNALEQFTSEWNAQISFAWPKSGFQTYTTEQIDSHIWQIQHIPDMTIKQSHGSTFSPGGTFTDIRIKPNCLNKYWVSAYKNNPIMIAFPISFSIYGIREYDGKEYYIPMFNPDYHGFKSEDLDAIKKYVLNNAVLASFFEITVDDIPGSAAIKGNPIDIKGLSENFIKTNNGDINFNPTKVYQLENRIVLAFESTDKKTALFEIDLNKRESRWLKQLEISLSLYHYSYKDKLYCILDRPLEGIDWYNPYTNQGGFLRFENPIPDYMNVDKTDIHKGILRYKGVNPANGNSEEIAIDIETGKVLNQTSQTIDWYFQTIISLN